MIPSTREIVYGLYGAWRLAHLDKTGVSYFDDSVEGFWKSFFAAALVAPAYAIEVALGQEALGESLGSLRPILIHLLAYSLSWTVFPVVVHPICQAMDRETAYVRYIVAYNWAKAIQMAIYLPVILIVWLEILPESLALLLHTVVYVLLVFGYQWFVTRSALDVKAVPASGLVALDFVVSFVLGLLVFGMLQ